MESDILWKNLCWHYYRNYDNKCNNWKLTFKLFSQVNYSPSKFNLNKIIKI